MLLRGARGRVRLLAERAHTAPAACRATGA